MSTSAQERWVGIQGILGTKQDGIPGPKDQSALDRLREEALREYRASRIGVNYVKASSFADPADVTAFRRCKLNGGSDLECFAVGDNGIGCWGDDTTGATPMCALPPEDMEERWGSVDAAKHKRVVVVINRRGVVCIVADRMPRRNNIKNGAGIDLNPGAQKLFNLKPPFLVSASWQWAVEQPEVA